MEFNPHPNCQDCGAELGWPGMYNSSEGAVEYNCMMCGMMEGITYIPPSEMPTEYLLDVYTYASRIDESLKMSAKSLRFEELCEALREELDTREVEVSRLSLTHRVRTNKRRSFDIEEEFPGVTAVGGAPDEFDYDSGLRSDEIPWESLVGSEEAARLEQWDDVTVEPVNA